MAKRPVKKITLHACFWGILIAGMTLYASEIEHHGFMVNGEAGYRDCLHCHDGVVASNVSPCLAAVCMLKDSHSVDKPYPPPDKAREYSSLAEAEMAGAKFINGRIDCISCHDLQNGERNHLRIDERKSRLCLACHIR